MKKIPCEVYTRVVGYYRPIQNWNEGKYEEYMNRVEFSEKASLNTAVTLTAKLPETKEEQEIIRLENIPTASQSLKARRYELFTLPNCQKCKEVKDKLSHKDIVGKTFDLSMQDGLKAVRDIYRLHRDRIKRNEDGSLPVPIVLFYNENNEVEQIVQQPEEVEKIA